MSANHDPYRVFVDQPNGETTGWQHPLRVAAAAKAAAEAAMQPVVLGPDNYGYVAPVPEGFIDSRPNPLEGATDMPTYRPHFPSLMVEGHEFLLSRV